MTTTGYLYKHFQAGGPGDGIDADAILATDPDNNPVRLPVGAIPTEFNIRSITSVTASGNDLTITYVDNAGTSRTVTGTGVLPAAGSGGGLLRFEGTSLPLISGYTAGQLALIPNDGIYEAIATNTVRKTVSLTGWTPVAITGGGVTVYGFNATNGTRPTGLPTTIRSMTRNANNAITVTADAGVFDQTHGIRINVASSVWSLHYVGATAGVETYASQPNSGAPWTTTAISTTNAFFTALGTGSLGNSTSSQWHLIQSLGAGHYLRFDDTNLGSGDNGSFPLWLNTRWVNGEIVGAVQEADGDLSLNAHINSLIAAAGAGDITAVLTPEGSGLRGGANSGSVSLSLVQEFITLLRHYEAGGWTDSATAQVSQRQATSQNLAAVEALSFAASVEHSGPNVDGGFIYVRLGGYTSTPTNEQLEDLRLARPSSDVNLPAVQAILLSDNSIRTLGSGTIGGVGYYFYEVPLGNVGPPSTGFGGSVDGEAYRVQADLPSRWNFEIPYEDVDDLEAHIRHIVDQEIPTLDSFATLNLTATAIGGNPVYGTAAGTGTDNFVHDGTTYILRKVERLANGNLVIYVRVGSAHLNTAAKTNLAEVKVRLKDGHILSFSNPYATMDVAGDYTEYQWENVPTTAFEVGANAWNFFEESSGGRALPTNPDTLAVAGPNGIANGDEVWTRDVSDGNENKVITARNLATWVLGHGTNRTGATIAEHTWTGDVSIAVAASDAWGPWTDLQTFTLSAGQHLLLIELFETRTTARTAWLGVQFRLQKDGADVWAEPQARRRNLRGNQGHLESTLQIPVDGSGTHVLQVRVRSDNHGNASPIAWAAANQLAHILTFTGGGSGGAMGQGSSFPDIVRSLWKAAASLPANSELTGANTPSLENDGSWADPIPNSWQDAPSTPTVGAGQELYEAVFLGTWNGTAYGLDGPRILVADAYNVQFSDSLTGSSPYNTPTANSVARRRRNPTTRQWGPWLPLAVSPSWISLVDLDLRTTQTSQVWSVDTPVKPVWNDIREFYIEIANESTAPWVVGRAVRKSMNMVAHTVTSLTNGATCRVQGGNNGDFRLGQTTYNLGSIQQRNDTYQALNILFRSGATDATRLDTVFVDNQKVLQSQTRLRIWYR